MKIIIGIEKVAVVHVLTRRLAYCVCNLDQSAYDEVSFQDISYKHECDYVDGLFDLKIWEVLNDINDVLVDQGDDVGMHGLMLSYQILQTCKSSRRLMQLLVTNFADLCRDFVCLKPINAQLSQVSKNLDVYKKFVLYI